jgi:hypothetical protein
MPYTLEGILAHVRAQGRHGSHQAVLAREIDRLRADNAMLRDELGWAITDIAMLIEAASEHPPVKETSDV